MNFNFENISNVESFDKLKVALQRNFDELLSKGYLYKGDMGETPQIFNRPLIEKGEWTALGKSIIGEIFKDTKNEKYKKYYKDGKVNIDGLIAELTEDGKLSIFNSATSSATYPWWCADGVSDYPIYPATYFVYIDSTPNDIRNDVEHWGGDGWKDDSCVLIPAKVEYNDYRDGAPEEEREPIVTYHKNHIYPTFYFDPNAKGAAAGAWCWEINGVQTGVPASVANDDGSVLGHMFIFKKDDEGVYHYKAGVNPNANEDWMTMEEMKKANLRYPIKGDIGFAIEKVKETGDNPTTTETTGGDSATIASINTLQIYNFVEDDNDSTNGGDWGLGGNLISFGESFYSALWEFISGDSGVEINKGKIILGTTNGNHCIFVKKDNSQTGQTLVLMPLPQGTDPTSKEDFEDKDTWKDAKLQINYPETTINGAVKINNSLDVSEKNINAGSIELTGDINCINITATGNIALGSTINCSGIITNNFVANEDVVTVGNATSPNLKVTDTSVDTSLPFTTSNSINICDSVNNNDSYIKIYADKTIDEVRAELGNTNTVTQSKTKTFVTEKKIPSADVKGSYNNNSGTDSCTVTVTYKSEEFDLSNNMKSITLSMPYSLGLTIDVNGKNRYGCWPLLSKGKMTLKIFAKSIEDEDIELENYTKTIARNTSSGNWGDNKATRYCTIYCSFSPEILNSASSKLNVNINNYKSIYITAEATFILGVDKGTWGYSSAIYKAGTACYCRRYTYNISGGSVWSSSAPNVENNLNIFKSYITVKSEIDPGKITTVSICPDGILIGKAEDNSAVFYINDNGFNIVCYNPGFQSNPKKVLSIDKNGHSESDIFELKTPS